MSDDFEEQDDETLKSLIEDPDWDCDQRWRAWCLLKQLESRLSALQWRPIAEYDAMVQKPLNCVFIPIEEPLLISWDPTESDTHFLQLPPVPGESAE